MNEKQLFDAINNIDPTLVDEAVKSMQISNKKQIKFKTVFVKLIAAVLTIITIAGTSLTVLACSNSEFKDWLYQYFSSNQITEITKTSSNTSEFNLDKDIRIVGTNECFIEKYKSDDNDNEFVNEVYQIKNNKLKQLKQKHFEGNYNNTPFSFSYCTINNEIDAFNCSENISTVFHYKSENMIHLVLDDKQLNTQYILSINLKSEEIKCINEHQHMCNMIMSPNGKIILLNYRALEYWSVFDLETEKETKIDALNPYTHSNEILFLNDYLIETYTYEQTENNYEVPQTIVIDLKTLKTKTVCDGTGDICVNWLFNYDIDKNALEIKNLYKNDSFFIENVSDKSDNYSISIMYADKNYALFYNESTKECYLCNLIHETSMKFNISDKLEETEIFVAGSENKLIITNNDTAYLIDIKEL